PEDYRAWQNHGKALMGLCRYKDAIASFEQVLTRKSDSYKAWYNKAVALSRLNRYTEALTSLNNALIIKPSCHYAWNYRGMVLSKLERFQESLASFDKSLQVKPNNANAWYGKACCYALQNNLDRAIEHLKQAIGYSPYLCQLMAKTDPNFNRIRSDQRFQALLQDKT
ncbi:MAG: tetratricopeptide repeat protein, partial [Leptolyngbyaceae cyanobacterium CAN_BIN12]|nr:tetratricopeptide repeat protein [Leptolyngbyaceae cyanobacterium CAN_BIN12]